ncbi:MAG: 1-acyl-sn-glycerol-3-phosphate acyltransferase [Bdellovibrionaceae bacterium]|nr:1-acyl-sn-glycerol-3-phosphate acyltransferase [Pseudobdellovibrionaceae bacterium]
MIRVLCVVRAVLGVLATVLFTGVICLLVLPLAALGRMATVDRLLLLWGRTILAFFNVKVQLHDMNNIPMDRGALVLFNHQSHFDIPCLSGHMPKRMRFGAKYELFKIPFFGAAMRAVGTLPILRENRSEVFRIYREAESKLAGNWSFALAPEGTRQARPEIGTFKKGPFLFAVNAQAPILPAVIAGAYDVLPKGKCLPNADRWTRTVHLRFLPPIETKGMSIADVHALTRQTQEKVVAAYADLRKLPTEPH